MLRKKTAAGSAVHHLLSHVKKQLAVPFLDLAKQSTELVEEPRFFTGAAPDNLIRGLAFGQVRQLRRRFAVIKELIERDFERTGQFFQRLDGRYGVAVLDAGNVTTQQSRPLLDVPLGELLLFAQGAKAVTDNHKDIIYE